jgi:exodeoxyribonuclease V alpha subunit
MALRGPGGALRVAFVQAGGVRWISPGRLAHVETAFAMTVHKSQGSEFAHALLVLGDGLGVTRELVYTGVTRARSRLSLYTAQEGALRAGLERVTRRSSGLPWRLRASGVDISS